MKRTLELTVAELCCADEAREIHTALGRLPGVLDVRTAVSARRAIVSYDAERVSPEAFLEAIQGLSMTVTDSRAPSVRSLPELLGWGLVSVVALVALVGIVGERLGLAETLVDRVPWWLALGAVLAGGYPIFRNVVRALRNRSVTSHALMTLGIVCALAIGQYAAAAVIVFFMRLADFIEGYTTDRSRQAIKELLKLAPETARVERDGRELEVPAEDVARGEVVVVKPGGRVPVDGTVLDGRASVDQAPVTGESVPVEKKPGDPVFAATICERGALRVRTERVGRDTTFGQIVRLVEEAEPPRRRCSGSPTGPPPTTSVVVGVAVLTYLIGGNATAAVATVLVACSCAIAMATPVTVLAAVGQATKRGIVIKGGRYLEALAKVDTIVMDKTGTLTIGRPGVADVVRLDRAREEDILALAASSSGGLSTRSPSVSSALPSARVSCCTSEGVRGASRPGVLASVNGERALCRRGWHFHLLTRGSVCVDSTICLRRRSSSSLPRRLHSRWTLLPAAVPRALGDRTAVPAPWNRRHLVRHGVPPTRHDRAPALRPPNRRTNARGRDLGGFVAGLRPRWRRR